MNIVPVNFQRDMFETEREEYLRMRLEKLEDSATRVRKKCFATINELTRQVEDLSIRVEVMERGICRE